MIFIRSKNEFGTIYEIRDNLIRVIDLPGEEWREIKGFPFYCVSNKGRVKRITYEKFYPNGHLVFYPEMLIKPLKTKQNKRNPKVYLRVNILNKYGKMKTVNIHRLVAKAFIPNPKNLPQVHHKDGNGCNNCVENLEWVSQRQNNADSLRIKRLSNSKKGKKRQPMTQEQKNKISQSLLNKKDFKPRKKVVSTVGEWKSAKEAAKFFKCPGSSFRAWLNGNAPMPEKYRKINLRYDDKN